MAPSSISVRACSTAGKKRVHTASCSMTPRSPAAAYMARASAAFSASGFSHSTCLPAATASRVCSLCTLLTVPTYTMSTSGAATMAA